MKTGVAIPAGAFLRFTHWYQFEASDYLGMQGWDGGVVEYSSDGGAWTDNDATGSGGAIANTLEMLLGASSIEPGLFGADAAEVLSQTRQILILACGTSFHAGMVARYWLESIAGVPCDVSSHAGTFCCNAVLYHALGQTTAPGSPAGFRHPEAQTASSRSPT